MARDTGALTVIRKKIVKKGGGSGHHGGAWKVAYADFVTAMMAFFLLMWLLNATTEKQRKGLADYFNPSIPISRTTAGGDGVLAGDDVLARGDRAGETPAGIPPRLAPDRTRAGDRIPSGGTGEGRIEPGDGPDETGAPGAGPAADPAEGAPGRPAAEDGAPGQAAAPEDPRGEAFAAAWRAEEARLERLGAALEAAVAAGDASGRFTFRLTPEGLVIEIADAAGAPLFASGSAAPEPVLVRLAGVLAPLLGRVGNPVAVIGHTDAAPFEGPAGYGNWELSADRANAARRLLEAAGLASGRIARVTGAGATEPIADDPLAPLNRRIAIKLLRQVRAAAPPLPQSGTAAAPGR